MQPYAARVQAPCGYMLPTRLRNCRPCAPLWCICRPSTGPVQQYAKLITLGALRRLLAPSANILVPKVSKKGAQRRPKEGSQTS